MKIKLSIRQLVELIMRSGNIDSRYASKDRMLEGAKAHRELQKANRELFEDYNSEVTMALEYSLEGIDYILEGRADGIFSEEGLWVIDEIKTTTFPLLDLTEDFNPTHWAQAQCYGYIWALQNNLPEIAVQLTYYHIESTEIKQFRRTFSLAELEEFLVGLLEGYSVWANFSAEWMKTRDHSIKELEFPFPAYRKGQRELAVSAYRTIASGKKLYAQAPTGTGKTISVLFPAVKAMGEGKTSKIFYLTAKTITRQVAEEAFARMVSGGLRMKTITLTAKEKICFKEQAICQPEHCEYAKGHFDRVNAAILDAVGSCDELSRPVIEEFAEKHQVCPFEFSLDLALLADCVICDYNYVFDPRAYLRRFFADGEKDYVFLIDEAHNLVDRSREMFSIEISKKAFYEVKKEYQEKSKALDKVLTEINKEMIQLRKLCGEDGHLVNREKPEALCKLITKFTSVCEELLKEDKKLGEDNEFLQLYFTGLHFLTIGEFYDDRYVTFVETGAGNEVRVKLFCLDPSFLLKEGLKRGGSAVLFSATFSPLEYFREILGGDEEDNLLALDSPFDKSRLCVMIANHVSTKFNYRQQSIGEVVELIGTFVSKKTGNYIVYFPSYKYLEDVYEEFVGAYPEIQVVKQEGIMSEEEREEFLDSFQEEPEETYVAFCVLGGIFAEGIDLQGSRLIGSVIVSVGLPQVSVQQNIIRDYFNEKNSRGFEYAYIYPGMNKVLQGAGRVIRTEQDRGAILLIDERYTQRNYARLLPKHWHPRRVIRYVKSMEEVLGEFWEAE